MDERGTATKGIAGEAASVAEHVKDFPVLGIAFEQASVVALVDEESGLLSFEPVDSEFQSVFKSDIFIAAAWSFEDEAIFPSQEVSLEWEGRFGLVVNVLDGALHHILQGFGYVEPAEMHPGRVGLHDGGLAVDVNDKSRQVVAFSVNEAVSVRHAGFEQVEAVAHLFCGKEALGPIAVVDLFMFVEGEDSDGDAAYLEMSASDEGPF